MSSREDVRTNWTEVFSDVPDLRVEVPAAVQDGNTIWSEWRMYGTARSGALLEIRGVIIFGCVTCALHGPGCTSNRSSRKAAR